MRQSSSTKNSVRFLTDEDMGAKIIVLTSRRIEGYQFRLIEEPFVTALEIYLDIAISATERRVQIREIFDIYYQAAREIEEINP